MKLIFCPEKDCQDVRKLRDEECVSCLCGKSGGYLLPNQLDAVIYGKAIPLGFANSSLRSALTSRPERGQGSVFTAFVIPKDCPTVKEMA